MVAVAVAAVVADNTVALVESDGEEEEVAEEEYSHNH